MNTSFRTLLRSAALPAIETPPENGTGYFDKGAMVSQLGVFTDRFGRVGVSIPVTETRSLLVFERYTDSDTLAMNTPHQFAEIVGTAKLLELTKKLLEVPVEKRLNIYWELKCKYHPEFYLCTPVTLEEVVGIWNM